VGYGNQVVNDTGIFQKEYFFSGTNISSFILDGTEYNFTFYEGENLYYLIKYIYNGQTFIING